MSYCIITTGPTVLSLPKSSAQNPYLAVVAQAKNPRGSVWYVIELWFVLQFVILAAENMKGIVLSTDP